MQKKRLILGIVVLLVLVPLFFALDLMLGSVYIPLSEIGRILLGEAAEKRSWEIIVIDSRLPKALTAIVSGIALSISGLQMQTLFRNPLAGPYILGISSGAGLGVAILTLGAQLFSLPLALASSSWMVVLFSIAGSGFVLLLIFWASLRLKDIMTVLILGVLLGSIISAIVSLLQYYGSAADLKSFVIWTFGSLDAVSLEQVGWLVIVVFTALLLVVYQAKPLNLLLMGESYARTMGLNVKASRLLIILTTGMLAGGVTAFCGPIGFIGIVVPHVCRLIFRTSDHRYLIPLSALVGAVIMLISDIVSHLPGSDFILPINAITAIIGIPLIIWMIFTKKVVSSAF
jgi:iron complex transport system permease protein